MRRDAIGATLPDQGAGERRVAARGVAWGGIECASAAAVGLILTPLVLRAAGLEGLGLWGAAWSLAHTAGLVDLGIGASYARFTARALARDDADDLNATAAVGVGFHLALAAAVALAAVLLGPGLLERVAPGSPRLPEARTVLACTLATVLLRGVLSVYRGVVAGAQRTDLLGRIGSAAALIEGAGGAAALAMGTGLRGLAVNSLVVAAATSAAEALVAHRLCPALRVRPFLARREQYRRLLGFGARLQVTRAFEILAAHAPRLILAAGPGLAAAGAYDLAARLAGLVGLGAALPLRVILPLAGHLDARGDHRRLDALLDHAGRYVALLALLPAAAVLLWTGSLLTAWTGAPPPPDCVAAARLLAAAGVLAIIAAPLRLVVRGLGHAGIEAASTAAGALTQVAALALTVTRLGAPGAALAALAGVKVAVLVLVALVRYAALPADPRTPARSAALVLACAAAATTAGIAIDHLLPGAGVTDRWTALLALAPRLTVVVAAFTSAAWLAGAIRAGDLAIVREAFGAPRGEPMQGAPEGAGQGASS